MNWIALVIIVIFVVIMIIVLNSTTRSEEEKAERKVSKTFKCLLRDNNMFATWLETHKGKEIAFNWRFKGSSTPTLTTEEVEDYQLLCYLTTKAIDEKVASPEEISSILSNLKLEEGICPERFIYNLKEMK